MKKRMNIHHSKLQPGDGQRGVQAPGGSDVERRCGLPGGPLMRTEWGFTNPDRKDFVVWGPVTEKEAREFVGAHPHSGSEVVRRQIGDWEVDIHE